MGTEIVPTDTNGLPENPNERLIWLAIQHDADIDKLEKLIELKNQQEARDAKRTFDEKFSAMQAEFTPVGRDKEGHGYKYAPVETLQKHYNATIAKFGFSYRWREEGIENGGKRCIMLISGHGHAEENTFDIPQLTGTQRMNAVQIAGAMSTYGRRYTFIAGFGTIVEDEDNDIEHYDDRTVKEVTTERALPDLDEARTKMYALIERAEAIVAPEVIESAKMDMEAAKTVEDMRSVYTSVHDIAKSTQAEINRVETKEGFDKAAKEHAEAPTKADIEADAEAAAEDLVLAPTIADIESELAEKNVTEDETDGPGLF